MIFCGADSINSPGTDSLAAWLRRFTSTILASKLVFLERICVTPAAQGSLRINSARLVNLEACIVEDFAVVLCERGGYVLVDRRIPRFGFFQPVVVPNIPDIEFRPLSREKSQPDIVNESPIEPELEHKLPEQRVDPGGRIRQSVQAVRPDKF